MSDRGDWQDRRENAREDWQNRYDDFYDRHDNWHHGCWNGNYGDWWHNAWDEYPGFMALGMTMWGINTAAYAFGYWGYSNPYYVEPYPVGGGAVLDYSQPIVLETAPVESTDASETSAPAEAPASPSPADSPGVAEFDAARQAFLNGDYATALSNTDKALALLPGDPIIHEFRALVMFATGKYREAAAGLHSVLAVGPGWDWTTLSSLYPNVDTYTKQLRALEQYLNQNQDADAARFVLAYHYLTAGNSEAAGEQYAELYRKTPQDTVIRELLALTAGPDALGPSTTPTPAPASPAAKIDPQKLAGDWVSPGPEGASFALALKPEGEFTWTYTQQGKPQTVEGVYVLEGDTLALEPNSGGTMLAQISPKSASDFHFAMLGAPPGDPGLDFEKR